MNERIETIEQQILELKQELIGLRMNAIPEAVAVAFHAKPPPESGGALKRFLTATHPAEMTRSPSYGR